MSTRGAISWVSNTPTGLPLWTSSVSSSLRRRSVRTMASKLFQSRAALPAPPYTTSWSGSSATSGSRLFISMRSAASCCQPLQLISVPRGARTGRGPAVVCVFTMPPRFAVGFLATRSPALSDLTLRSSASSFKRRRHLSKRLDAISFPNTGTGRDAGIGGRPATLRPRRRPTAEALTEQAPPSVRRTAHMCLLAYVQTRQSRTHYPLQNAGEPRATGPAGASVRSRAGRPRGGRRSCPGRPCRAGARTVRAARSWATRRRSS